MHRHKAFPLSMVTTGRRLLLVGGGALGESRLETALRFDWAQITFVAPDPTEGTRELAAADNRVALLIREPVETDVQGVHLVIESTLDADLAARLHHWCAPRRIPLNAMDKLEYCDVYYQALIMRGPLLLAISSGGETPSLAATLRRLLESRIGPGWCNAARLLADTRRGLPQTAARMELLKGIASDRRFLELIGENNIAGMQDFIKHAVDSASN